MDKQKDLVIWLIVVIVSFNFILIGGKIATHGVSFFGNNEVTSVKAEVIQITDDTETENQLGVDGSYKESNIDFICRILKGKDKGKEVKVTQNINSMYGGSENLKHVEKGDMVLIMNALPPEMDSVERDKNWHFIEFYRFDKVMYLGLVFAFLIILIGKKKGVNALISLGFTAAFVFYVLLPWILGGRNIYLGVAITCVFTIVMTLLLIEGITRKSFVTMISCAVGTLIAAAIPFAMNHVLHLSGLIDEHSFYLTMLNPDKPIDLIGIIYAGIIIGALGAIMDVAMDISSSLYEITQHVPDIQLRKLFKSGMSIGSDIMGTMSNTLVLAYIGSSLCSVLLLFTYSASLTELLNREVVIVELLQTFAGSIALLLTVPFTVIIAGFMYIRWNGRSE